MSRLAARGLAALALGVVSFACAPAPKQGERPPVFLIVVDTLRADHLPAYGYRGVATPAIDALAKDAVLFENAYAHVPLTLPSHATLMTGLLPYENGVRDNVGFRLDPGRPTVASLLKVRGYATGAAVSTFALRRDRGLDRGFDLYDDRFDASSPDERPGPETVRVLEGWIGGVGDAPIFAWLHLYEPHTPYAPPEPYRSRYAASPYDGEIAAADAAVGLFLETLRRKKLYDPALVIFLSDHGEGLGDHGESEHGVFLYREALRVPLLIKYPRARWAGRRVANPVGLVDVPATILALAGGGGMPGSSGVSLADAVAPRDRAIYAETLYPRLQLGWSDLASMTNAAYHYIDAPRPELYDLASDAAERHDLAAARPPALRTLRLALDALRRAAPGSPRASPEEIARLGAIGYIHVQGARDGRRDLPDPKDRIAALAKYKALFDAFYGKRDAEAAARAREILAGEPQILSVWRILAGSLERAGQPREAGLALETALRRPDIGGTPEDHAQAIEQLAGAFRKAGDRRGAETALRAVLARGIAEPTTRRELAKVLIESGRGPEALPVLEAAAPPAPADADGLDLWGVALAEANRLGPARDAFQRALAADPRNASAMFHLGALSLREKDPAAARGWLEKSLALHPDAPATLTELGLAKAALGDAEAAAASWSRAVALDPTQYDALYNLGVAAGRAGKVEEARRALSRFVASAPPGRYAERLAEARRLLGALSGS